MDRFLKKQIITDLNDKMVFLAGPRQVGKTTLVKSIDRKSQYLNWDIDEDRTRILNKEFQTSKLWIFDEIHKYKNWRNYLKGLFDKTNNAQKILVTGSARLDILRKGGDSLQGRYHFLRLLPLTYNELKMNGRSDLNSLFELSGFPEPFFKSEKTYCNRWSRSYRERIVRQEVATQEQFVDLGTIELMLNRLPELTCGLVSINSLAEDIQVDHKTLAKWILALERLYAVFKVAPYGPPKIKAIKKEQKVYFYDWNAIQDPGTRFENLVAVHLLKWVYYLQDVEGRNLDLRYYRDKNYREVDFVVLEDSKPIIFIEAKLGDSEISKGLRYMKSKFPKVRSVQIHLYGYKEFFSPDGIEVLPAHKFLQELV